MRSDGVTQDFQGVKNILLNLGSKDLTSLIECPQPPYYAYELNKFVFIIYSLKHFKRNCVCTSPKTTMWRRF